jgi:hypothetical protein
MRLCQRATHRIESRREVRHHPDRRRATRGGRACRARGSLLPNSLNGPLTPSVLAEMLGWIGARRSLDGFDVAAEGVTPATARVRAAAVVEERHAAGAT